MLYIIKILYMLCDVYTYIILIRVLVSWFSPDPYNPFFRVLLNITEPVMEPFRRHIPTLGGIDFSPIIIILIIEYIIKNMVLGFLASQFLF